MPSIKNKIDQPIARITVLLSDKIIMINAIKINKYKNNHGKPTNDAIATPMVKLIELMKIIWDLRTITDD